MPTISRSIRLSKGNDGGVLLDVEQGAIFSLNSVGARIVELLQAQQATASIVSQISREFGASEQVVSTDVADFLRSLHERGLLEGPKQAGHDSEM
jgi:Coenzyme PQQ synthesis protein D (PqqD)